MTHIMCDIETLGTRPGAIVLSIAMVRFSDEAHFSLNLPIPEQEKLGLEIDQMTHDWWSRQDAAAWQAATVNPLSLVPALQYVAQWLAWAGDNRLIWCHGATFDCPLVGEVFRRVGIVCPWQFWEVRDTRTLYDLAGINVKDYAVPPPHIALNDAIGQTRAANAALKILAGARGLVAP